MNLITDAWIPVQRRKSLARELIRPYEIVNQLEENPYLSVDSSRPDFSGALLQFLIGIIQTVMTPDDEVEWVERFINPPSTEDLEKLMEPISPYFELEGSSIKFMQEEGMDDGIVKMISSLLIDSPGENTIKGNTDHFIKRNRIHGMCEACTATALFTLNTNAPSGGKGNMVSIRGGGPLTIVVMPDNPSGTYSTLWHTIFLNVLDKQDLKMTMCNSSLDSMGSVFPWVTPQRTSQTQAIQATINSIHPLQTYWAMPRRTLLDAPEKDLGTCDVCGASDVYLFSSYKTRPYGMSYGPGIIHPLSPYYSSKEGLLLPTHPQPGGFTYRHWPLYITSNDPLNPRPILLRILDGRLRDLREFKIKLEMRVKVFGYDMDNMKPRCWYESTMPYWLVPKEIKNVLVEYSSRLAEAATQVARNTRLAVKEVWFSKGSKIKTEPNFVDKEFWDATEEEFYQSVHALVETFLDQKKEEQDILERWLDSISRMSLVIYDSYADQIPLDSGGLNDQIPRQIKARNTLVNSNTSKRIRETILGLTGKKTIM